MHLGGELLKSMARIDMVRRALPRRPRRRPSAVCSRGDVARGASPTCPSAAVTHGPSRTAARCVSSRSRPIPRAPPFAPRDPDHRGSRACPATTSGGWELMMLAPAATPKVIVDGLKRGSEAYFRPFRTCEQRCSRPRSTRPAVIGCRRDPTLSAHAIRQVGQGDPRRQHQGGVTGQDGGTR